MCTVSMIADHYHEKWRPRYPDYFPPYSPPWTLPLPQQSISREEFDALRKEVQELAQLLKRAKKYDEDNGEPDCETETKMASLRLIAALGGLNLDELLAGKPSQVLPESQPAKR